MTERATSLVIFHPSAYNGHGDDVSISREFFPAHVARVTAGFQRGLAVEGAGMNLCERYFSPLATVLCFGMTAAHLAGDDSHSSSSSWRQPMTHRPTGSVEPAREFGVRHFGCPTFWPRTAPVFVYSPLILPAEEMYGPQSLRRFVGIDLADASATSFSSRAIREKSPPNAELRGRIGRLLRAGDVHFRQQKFAVAAERYRTAAEASPILPESHLRLAITHFATGNYEAAARSMRRALRIQPSLTSDDSPLPAMYGDDPVPKQVHLDALAAAVEKSPENANLHLVLGMVLALDDKHDAAQLFLRRCDELGGNASGLLDELLDDDPTKPNAGRAAAALGAPPRQQIPRANEF